MVGKTFVNIASMSYNIFATTDTGKVYACGYNQYGELGSNAAIGSNYSPVLVAFSPITTSVVKGVIGSLVSTSVIYYTNSTYYGIGDNLNGKFGMGGNTAVAGPAVVIGTPYSKTSIISASLGQHALYAYYGISCFAIFQQDPKVCSGHGNCTDVDTCSCVTGYTGADCIIPICFGISGSNTSVCSGNGMCYVPDLCHCRKGWKGTQCELSVAGYAYVSGYDVYGGMADNFYGSDYTETTPFSPSLLQGRIVNYIHGGFKCVYVIFEDGTLWGVGLNLYGQLGDNTTVDYTTDLVKVQGLPSDVPMIQVCGGYGYAAALDRLGRVYTWGDNSAGQLGRTTTPTAIAGQVVGVIQNETVAHLICSLNHVGVITQNGSLYMWGTNAQGDANGARTVPKQTYMDTNRLYPHRMVQFSIGREHGMALVDDGAICKYNNIFLTIKMAGD
jgi:alpha-tubulin suppressor-like RCC1 family protein